MMISIAASRILRAAAERQRGQQLASNHRRLGDSSISGQGSPGNPSQRPGSPR